MEKHPLATCEIRALCAADEWFLWEMLYLALYVPPGQPPFPREILQRPEICRYVEGWGCPFDLGYLALDHGRPIGAAWLRLLRGELRGYGYLDETTPELSIAILPAYRGQGIGARLMTRLLKTAHRRYRAVCLSVLAKNPAWHNDNKPT